jgi:hypothetical protein
MTRAERGELSPRGRVTSCRAALQVSAVTGMDRGARLRTHHWLRLASYQGLRTTQLHPAATVVFMGDSIHRGSRVHHATQLVQSSGMTAMPNSRVLRRSPGVLSGQARPPGLAANPQIMRYARILTPPVRPSWSAWRQRRGGQGARPIQPNRTHRHRDDGDHGKRFWWSCGSWPSKPRSWRAHSASQHSCLGRLSRN